MRAFRWLERIVRAMSASLRHDGRMSLVGRPSSGLAGCWQRARPEPCSAAGRGVVEAMSRKTYTARCRRSQGWWAIGVPEVPGALSQARRLGEVERMVRDVVALAL